MTPARVFILCAYSRTEVELEEVGITVQRQQWFFEVHLTDLPQPLCPLYEQLLIMLVQNIKKMFALLNHIVCLYASQRPRRRTGM